jgi:hypothetical protein
MKNRNLSLVGRTVAFRTLDIVGNDVERNYRILKVEAVHPYGYEVAGTDDEGNNIACETGDIIRVF